MERFHQSLKRWLRHQRRATSVAKLGTQLEEFRAYYNAVRPHRALGRRTPQEAYDARPKALPKGVPLDDAHYRVRHDTIDANGKVTLRYGARLHHIGVGRRHKGLPVLVLVKDRHVRITTTDGELLRDFELDPSRDYQPQPKP